MNWNKPYRGIFAILSSFIFLFGLSCKDEYKSSIPYVGVYYDFQIANHNGLTVMGGGEFFPNLGYGGIWVVHGIDDVFYAYDATCPYEANPLVIVDCDGGVGTCTKCGTKYFMLDGGYVLSETGPGTEQLRSYSATSSGGRIYLRN
ncbi:MAG: Rieske (2Fe-2S) protein [Mangrovibacterium sp.]